MNTSTLLLKEKKYLTEDILHLIFEKPADFAYLAGQFVQFHIPDGESMVKRAYSIVSIPRDETIEFCLKVLPDGKASTYFTHLPIGASATIETARGRFICEEVKSLGFIATGTGIAPVISLIRDQLESKASAADITLLFGLRHHEDVFWQTELDALVNKYDNFSYEITLSQEKNLEEWFGKTGRVTEHLDPIDPSKQYFLCGSAPMVKDVRGILLAAGIDAKAVHFEIF